MKKKLLALVMSFTVVLSLAACGGGPDAAPDGDSGSADGGGKTVVIAMALRPLTPVTYMRSMRTL